MVVHDREVIQTNCIICLSMLVPEKLEQRKLPGQHRDFYTPFNIEYVALTGPQLQRLHCTSAYLSEKNRNLSKCAAMVAPERRGSKSPGIFFEAWPSSAVLKCLCSSSMYINDLQLQINERLHTTSINKDSS
jgi:hypothetical protein